MIISSEATVLQIRHWSRTSHMVTWLTPDYGRIVTPVKGAVRPKSAFLGQYDLYYTCDLLFYRREYNGVHAIRECTPLKLRETLRNNWRNQSVASYIANLTAHVTPDQLSAQPLYTLLTQTLDLLNAPEPRTLPPLILWYEVHLLRHLGLLPDISTCPECHTPDILWLRFSIPSGRFTCHHSSKSHSGENSITLHRGVVRLFNRLLNSTTLEQLTELFFAFANNKSSGTHNLLLGLSRFLGIFITFHLEVSATTRRIAWEMVETTPAQTVALKEKHVK